MVSAPAGGFCLPGIFDASGSVVVVDEGGDVAAELSLQLTNLGIAARVERDPALAGDCSGVIYLGGLRPVGSIHEAAAMNRDAFLWARAAGTALMRERGFFVSVQDTGGSFGLSGANGYRPWISGLPGLVKTAGLEWPGCAVKAIDIECEQLDVRETASRILDELTAGGPEIEVGLKADRRRITLVDVPASPGSSELPGPVRSPLREELSNSVIVVSGGARGVTAKCLEALAAEAKLRLVLLGRTRLAPEADATRAAQSEAEIARALYAVAERQGTPLTPKELRSQVKSILSRREITRTVANLENRGAEVKYLDVDVQDEPELRLRLQEIRAEWGPITGLVHAAGVISDKPIVEKTDEQFSHVFGTKVMGLAALLNATAADPLRFICLFSSVAARAGNVGQTDYAMANEVLNRVAAAEAERREACRVKAIGWGAWNGGMVTPELRRHFEGRGVRLIPVELGARHFVDELLLPEIEVVVLPQSSAIGLGGSGASTWSMEIRCDERHFPCLADHVIADVPVVPVALVIDWFSRAAAACRPGFRLVSIDNLHVMKGILLRRFGRATEPLRLSLSESSPPDGTPDGAELQATLRSVDGELHYQATVCMERQKEGRGEAGWSAETIEANRPGVLALLHSEMAAKDQQSQVSEMLLDEYDPYREHLFHGPAFRAIAGIEKASDSSVITRLKPFSEIAELTSRNTSNVARAVLLDAGLQTARLWGIRMTGKKTLPMLVRHFVAEPGETPVRCVVLGRSASDMRVISDVFMTSDDGHVCAAMLGLETYALNDSRKA